MILTKEIELELEDWHDFKGNGRTIRSDGFRQLIGWFSEYEFQKRFKDAIRISQTDHEADFILKSKRIDVKCTISNSPVSDWNGLPIEALQKDFSVDWYCFYHYHIPTKKLTFLGWKEKKSYFLEAKLFKAGDEFPFTGKKVLSDCYLIKVAQIIRGDGKTTSP